MTRRGRRGNRARQRTVQTHSAAMPQDPTAPIDPRAPYVKIQSITADPFDFFPELRSSPEFGDGKILRQLKSGSYKLYMSASRYDGEWSRKSRTMTASLAAPIDTAPRFRTFSASLDSDDDRIRELAKTYDRKMPITSNKYMNPRQYYDYLLLESAYKNTPAGISSDTWNDYVFPRQLRPVLRLREPSGDPAKDAQKIRADSQKYLPAIAGVMDWFSDLGPKRVDGYHDTPLNGKLKAALKMSDSYGWSMLVKENWEDRPHPTVKGEAIEELPNAFKFVHPMEMGMVEVERYTGKAAGIWLHNERPFVPADECALFINEPYTPMIGAFQYGFSRAQRVIDLCRLYWRMVSRSIPQYLKVSATGMGMFTYNSAGMPEANRTNMETQLRNLYTSGEIGTMDVGNVGNVQWNEFKVNTDIAYITNLLELVVKLITNGMGVPHAILYDDGAAAHATLAGKLVGFERYPVTQRRQTFGFAVGSQILQPFYRTIYADEQSLLKEYWLDVEFEPVNLETPLERIERLLQENQLNPYTLEWLGQQLEDPQYSLHVDKQKIDELKRMRAQMPGQQPGQGGGSQTPGMPGRPGAGGGSGPKTFGIKDHTTQMRRRETVTPL